MRFPLSLSLTLLAFTCLSTKALAPYEEQLLWSFEDTSTEGWQTDNGATFAVEAAHPTHGDRTLRVTFPRAQSRFSVRKRLDVSAWNKLKFDVYNPGEPFILTLRADDAYGNTYTSWYQRVGKGASTLEYNIRGFTSTVPDRGKVEALDPTAVLLIDLRVDQEIPQPATAYFDNIRLTRGTEPFVPPEEPITTGRPVEAIPGDLIANGNFELGLQGWGTWGEWDGGSYTFGTGAGGDAYAGTASAAILCETVGRGGIWSRFTIAEAGTYRLKFAFKGRNGADSMRLTLLPAENGFSREIPVAEEWTVHEQTFEARPGDYTLYLFHISAGELYLDAASLAPLEGDTTPPSDLLYEAAPSRVVVRQDRTLVDGAPFFPIGIYGVQDPAADLAGTGINLAIGNAVEASSPQWYAKCSAAGVMTVANLTGLLRGHLPEKAPILAGEIKDRPALLCYYLCDEPDHARWNVTPAEIRQARYLLAGEDPDHPSLALVMAWHRSMAYQYADAADIIASDPYSIDDMDKPVRSTLWMEDARAEKQPVWVVLQAGWDDTPAPSEAALVGQAYSAIASGADGIFWFELGWCKQHPQQWEIVRRISRELREIHDPLCWEEPEEMQPTFSDERIIGILKKQGNEILLIAVNRTLETVDSATINVPGLGTAAGLELFDGAEIEFTRDQLPTDFTPGQRRVYRFPAASTSVKDPTGFIPAQPSLQPGFPNPFNGEIAIRFSLIEGEKVELGIFDLAGQQVATLASGPLQAGTHTVYWNGRDHDGDQLASGVYLYSLRTPGQREARKLVLLK